MSKSPAPKSRGNATASAAKPASRSASPDSKHPSNPLELSQTDRVALVARHLRSFQSLSLGLGIAMADGTRRVPKAAVDALAEAVGQAGDCLKAGGVLTPDGLIEKPDYCFPVQWQECLSSVLVLWLSITEVEHATRPRERIPVEVIDRAGHLAAALENASMTVSVGIDGTRLSLPLDLDSPERSDTAVPAVLDSPKGSAADFKPASWFGKAMAARLRQATRAGRKTKRVRTRMVDGVKLYSVSDARRWWSADVPKDA